MAGGGAWATIVSGPRHRPTPRPVATERPMLLLARLPFLAAFLLSAGESVHSRVEEGRRNAEDLRTLQAVGAPTDGPGLVRFLLAQVVR